VGRPLDTDARVELESALGHDFTAIRVHTDELAAEAAALMGAEAFTLGEDIYFAEGAYRPDDPAGQQLLAHELTIRLQPAAEPAVVDTPALVRPQRTDRASLLEPQIPLAPGEILERLATMVAAHFQQGPSDETEQARAQLGDLSDEMRKSVLERAQSQVSEAEQPFESEVAEATSTDRAVPDTATGGPALAPAGEQPKLSVSAEAREGPEEEAVVNKPPRLPRLVDGKAEATAQGASSASVAALPAGAAVATLSSEGGGAASRGATVTERAAAMPAAGTVEEATPLATPPGAGLAIGSSEAQPPARATEGEAKPAAEGANEGGAMPGLATEASIATLNLAQADLAGEREVAVNRAPAEEPVADRSSESAVGTTTSGAAKAAAEGELAPTDTAPLLDERASESDAGDLEPTRAAKEPEAAAIEAPSESTTQEVEAPSSESAAADAPPVADNSAMARAPDPLEATPQGEDPELDRTGDPAETTGSSTAVAPEPADAVEAPDSVESAPEPTATAQAGEPTLSAADAAADASPVEVAAGAETAAQTPIANPPIAEPGWPGAAAPALAAPVDFAAEMGDIAGGAAAVDAGGGGAGGGGGGGAIEGPPPPSPPDVSTAEPAQAMGAMAGLRPAQLKVALGAVSAASTRAVSAERQQLAANPPSIERPSGAPAEHPTPANPEAVASSLPTDKAGHVDPVPQATAVPTPNPVPPPDLAPPPRLPATQLSGQASGDAPIGADDAARMISSVDALPTTDPELAVSAGESPELTLAGDADPTLTTYQRSALDQSVGDAQTRGARDVAQNMGEDRVYPVVPAETLKAEIPSGGGAGPGPAVATGGGEGGGGDVDEETASIVAEAKKGDEIRSSVGEQSAAMDAKKQAHDKDVEAEKSKTQQKVDEEIQNSAELQQKERAEVTQKVAKHRQDWSQAQQDAVDIGNRDADAAQTGVDLEVSSQQKSSRAEAQKHIDDGNQDIQDARKSAEEKAKAEQTKAKNETSGGGFFSWLGSKVKSFFDGIKQAIHAAFDAARKLVKAAIKKAQELATAVIEKARKAIVAAIRKAGDLLIKIGDTVLAAFPEARDKFRKLIVAGVKAAEDAVNELAEGLRKTIVAVLDLLGKALDAYLGLLEKAYLMAVDAVSKVVEGALKFAKAVAQGFAAFAALIKDIAANPGQWLRNLAASVLDGIKNHVVNAFKTAIRQWFDDTVEQVLGIGKTIIKVLKEGGIPWSKIGAMAWEALKVAIPIVLIELLIEKLVSMVVPAAGAVLVVLQGLQAAWGAIQRIIAAFDLFFTFLKAVKGGSAGPQFAAALAAAAIVVIQFVAFWLLRKLIKPAAKIGARLKLIAAKIMASLKKVAKAVIKGVKAVARAVKKGAKAAAGALKKAAKAVGKALVKGAKAVGRVLKKVGKKLANTKLGKALVNAAKKLKAKVKEWKNKAKKKWDAWKEKRKKRKAKSKQDRLEKAVAAIRPALARLLARGSSKYRILLMLGFWRVRHRLSSLKIESSGTTFSIRARVNPETVVLGGVTFSKNDLLRFLREVCRQILTDAELEKSRIRRGRDAAGRPTTHVPSDISLATEIPKDRTRRLGRPQTQRRVRRPSAGDQRTETMHKQGEGADPVRKRRNEIVSGVPGGVGGRPVVAQPYLPDPIKGKEGLSTQLNELPKAGHGISEFFQRGRHVVSMDPHKAAEVSALLLQEAKRHPLAVAEGAMLVMTAKAQEASAQKPEWNALLKAFPMQRDDATVIHEQLDRHLDQMNNAPPKPGSRTEKLREDIVLQIRAWVEAMSLQFDTVEHGKATIERLVRKFWAMKNKE
jgi:hypothetical protein